MLVTGMPSQTKSFDPNKRVATGSRNKKKNWEMSRKEFLKAQAYMRLVNKAHHKVNFGSIPEKQFLSKHVNIGQPISAKRVNNSAAKGASKSNHVPTSKGMKQPTPSSFKKMLDFGRETEGSLEVKSQWKRQLEGNTCLRKETRGE